MRESKFFAATRNEPRIVLTFFLTSLLFSLTTVLMRDSIVNRSFLPLSTSVAVSALSKACVLAVVSTAAHSYRFATFTSFESTRFPRPVVVIRSFVLRFDLVCLFACVFYAAQTVLSPRWILREPFCVFSNVFASFMCYAHHALSRRNDIKQTDQHTRRFRVLLRFATTHAVACVGKSVAALAACWVFFAPPSNVALFVTLVDVLCIFAFNEVLLEVERIVLSEPRSLSETSAESSSFDDIRTSMIRSGVLVHAFSSKCVRENTLRDLGLAPTGSVRQALSALPLLRLDGPKSSSQVLDLAYGQDAHSLHTWWTESCAKTASLRKRASNRLRVVTQALYVRDAQREGSTCSDVGRASSLDQLVRTRALHDVLRISRALKRIGKTNSSTDDARTGVVVRNALSCSDDVVEVCLGPACAATLILRMATRNRMILPTEQLRNSTKASINPSLVLGPNPNRPSTAAETATWAWHAEEASALVRSEPFTRKGWWMKNVVNRFKDVEDVIDLQRRFAFEAAREEKSTSNGDEASTTAVDAFEDKENAFDAYWERTKTAKQRTQTAVRAANRSATAAASLARSPSLALENVLSDEFGLTSTMEIAQRFVTASCTESNSPVALERLALVADVLTKLIAEIESYRETYFVHPLPGSAAFNVEFVARRELFFVCEHMMSVLNVDPLSTLLSSDDESDEDDSERSRRFRVLERVCGY